ncbi:MAG TPA: methylmalonyl-CoA epimerase [bacterium]
MTAEILGGSPRLDHVGIAVSDLQAAELLYTAALGGRVLAREELPAEHVRLVFIDAAGALFELLAPTAEDGALAQFLRSRGEGFHHLAFEVADLDATLRDAVAGGMRVVDEHPRRGARGRLIAFLHPSAARGVLVELVQRPRA